MNDITINEFLYNCRPYEKQLENYCEIGYKYWIPTRFILHIFKMPRGLFKGYIIDEWDNNKITEIEGSYTITKIITNTNKLVKKIEKDNPYPHMKKDEI